MAVLLELFPVTAGVAQWLRPILRAVDWLND
jgi:hypothetical protein